MDIKALTERMDQFVQDKGWYDEDSPRPQTPRNLAISLHLETSEILELYQWGAQRVDKESLAEELADVALYLLQISRVSEIDLEEAILRKLQANYQRSWPEEGA
ncbi:MAG: MazG-like family protein [Anaerolineales bacterium]